MGWVLVAFGAVTLCGAAFDWSWYMGRRKARFLVRALGRSGARLLYGLLGSVFVVLGLLIVGGIL
jgi:hypothetical protein